MSVPLPIGAQTQAPSMGVDQEMRVLLPMHPESRDFIPALLHAEPPIPSK